MTNDNFYDAGDVSPEMLDEMLSDNQYGGDRNRPYNGQSWTDLGERGKTLV